tara:strand:- start:328 stop:1197 length:870 start_codon:yes stop_codon:yes gene_type:complete
MPELPEVEVVRRSLSNLITGLKITNVVIFNSNLRFKITKNLKKNIKNQKISSIKRRAKFLLIKLKNKKVILIHLGMTGKIFIRNNEKKSTLVTSFYYNKNFIKKHNHLKISLNNSVDLIYNDVRKFGFIKLIDHNQLNKNLHICSLGPEPLSKEFNFKYLKSKITKSKKNIKNFMMDQKYISGLGNIYVNEILFYSAVNPRKIVNKLTNEQVVKIVFNTKKTLRVSIQLGGSSIKNFNTTSGQKGTFQQKFMVYERFNQLCKKRNCRGNIKKIYLGNRSTFFCTKCQNN